MYNYSISHQNTHVVNSACDVQPGPISDGKLLYSKENNSL